MTTVVVNRRSANIVVKAVSGVLTPATSSGVTLNNMGPAAGIGVMRLDALLDVVEGTPSNNDSLVYNEADDKYYVQAISLDGGNF